MAHSENATIVEGTADQEQLVVRAHSTQTTSPLVVENSSGTDVFTVSVDGNAAIAGTTSHGGHVTMADAKNIVLNTTTGTKIGTATGQKLGFWNATPVVQQAAPTAALTTITHTAPTPDYAIQNVTNSSPYGFVTADEANTVLSVIANLQARVNTLATALANVGITA